MLRRFRFGRGTTPTAVHQADRFTSTVPFMFGLIDECISRQTQDGSPLPFSLSPTPFHRFAFKGWGEGWGEGCMLTSALMNNSWRGDMSAVKYPVQGQTDKAPAN